MRQSVGKEREGRSLFGILKGFSLVVIWGLFGVTYNIYSKEALEIVHAPLCLGFFQLCVGSSIVLLTWAVSPPSIAVKDSYKYVPIAACHLIGSFGTIVSMNFSSVGFTHIVKAGEPIATAFFSYMLSSRMYSAFTYGTLLLIVVGISLASANELKFSYTSLISSSIAAVFYPFRIVLSKKAGEVPSMGLSGKILFRLLTVLANALAVPLLAYDIFVSDNLTNMIDMLLKDDKLIFLVLLSGASFHIYSEVMFIILESVSPLSLAVINSSRRIAIIYSSVVVFGDSMTSQGCAGCIIAIAGAFLFSISNI